MNLIELKAAKVNDLKDGEMKTVSAGDGKEILLTRIDGAYYAFGANCTHYGAPLAEGILCNGVIMCPWHHACFDAKTGNMIEPPARDSLPKYLTKTQGDEVIVMLPEVLESSRPPHMTKANLADKRKYVILGGGAAGNAASQALREAGYTGKIIMITKEEQAPYDRPNLSKAYLSGEALPEWMPLRSEDFYKEFDIEILYNTEVTEVSIATKEIHFNNNGKLKFDKILIATGGVPRTLNIPGSDLKNIFYLRSFNDCNKIIDACKNAQKAVVIGSSFIGMEVAHSLHERKIDITVISPDDIPFKNIFGSEIGELIKSLHEENGIKFKLNSQVSKFEGDNKVTSVVLKNGEMIDCDFVVVGIGVKPGTDFIKGIDLEKDGSIKVDEFLQTAEDIFAAGDIAMFPYNGNHIRIEHWRTAEQHGRIAGFNMAGKKIKFNKQPFFWTEQAGKNIRYVGYAKGWDEIVTWGKTDSKTFISFLVKENKVAAAIGCNRDTEMAAIEQLMRHNKMPSASERKGKEIDLINLVSK